MSTDGHVLSPLPNRNDCRQNSLSVVTGDDMTTKQKPCYPSHSRPLSLSSPLTSNPSHSPPLSRVDYYSHGLFMRYGNGVGFSQKVRDRKIFNMSWVFTIESFKLPWQPIYRQFSFPGSHYTGSPASLYDFHRRSGTVKFSTCHI